MRIRAGWLLAPGAIACLFALWRLSDTPHESSRPARSTFRVDMEDARASAPASFEARAVVREGDPLRRELDRILGDPSGATRTSRLLRWMEKLQPEDFERFVRRFIEMENAGENLVELRSFVTAWVIADGQGAMESLGQIRARDREPAVESVFPMAFGTWAKAQPASAATWLSSQAPDPTAFQLLSTLAPEMRQVGREAAASWVRTIDDFDFRSESIAMLAVEFGQSDPRAAANWISSFRMEDEGRTAAAALARQWVRSDGPSALRWIRGLPPGDIRHQALEAAATAWTQIDPLAASEWLEGNRGDRSLEPAVLAFARVAASFDPAGAMEWVETLQDDQLRQIGMRAVWPKWREAHPAEAARWLGTTPMSPVLAQEFSPGTLGKR